MGTSGVRDQISATVEREQEISLPELIAQLEEQCDPEEARLTVLRMVLADQLKLGTGWVVSAGS